MKRFDTILIHFSAECDLKCPFCYKKGDNKDEKPRSFFLDLIAPLSEITNQIALGGGEPLLDPIFIMKFADKCKKNGLIFNFTTNGKAILKMKDCKVKSLLENTTMVSVSFDSFKWGNNPNSYHKVVQKIKQNSDVEIGSNVLIDNDIMRSKNTFLQTIIWLFEIVQVDRVFCLYPKNIHSVNIIQFKDEYEGLTNYYEHFYVDNLTSQILKNGYKNWKNPCHYGKQIININENGAISGCSFDTNYPLVLECKDDIYKLVEIEWEERFFCPYLYKPYTKIGGKLFE